MANTLKKGDVLKTTFVVQNVEQVAMPAVHYQIGTLGTNPGTDLDFVRAIDLVAAPFFIQLCNSSSTYLGTMAQRVDPLPIYARVESLASQAPCTGGGQELPRQTAALISWHTNDAYPSGRGRLYTPFPPVTANGPSGTILPAYQGTVQGLATALLQFTAFGTGAGSTQCSLVLYGYELQTVKPIVDWTVQGKWATQRRRGGFGRANVSPF
jgi:hypothetical protein